jgi:pimeloyl-ACP methyl ester carboxylesterase
MSGKRATLARAVWAAAAVVVLAASARIYSSYRSDIVPARERVASASRIVQTPCGPIEYATAGDGPAILVVHGAGGGFDQGLDIGRPLATSGFRVIAMSRFGYLRTPLPGNASAQAQADAHACLLDALGIERASIMGVSAGAPSTLQFAIRHPARTAAVILMVPAAYVPRDNGDPSVTQPRWTAFLFDTALRSDFLFWCAIKVADSTVSEAVLGTPAGIVNSSSAQEHQRFHQAMLGILPVSPRRLGLLNDSAITSTLPRYELERIKAPMLLISAKDDLYGTYDAARYTAQQVPGARFMGYEKGGHLLVGHFEQAQAEIVALLKSSN